MRAGGAVAAGALASAGGAWAATAGRGVVDLTKPTSPFPHIWKPVVGGDWAKQALRRDYQDHLLEAHRDLGVESLRFHDVFNSAMSVYDPTVPLGPISLPRPGAFTQDRYSFFNVDQIYDFLVEHGMHPFVELSSMPDALAATPSAPRIFLYRFNSAEPADYAEWGRLVGDFARHLVSRYGIGEVARWPFEVWNEPNIPFFAGDEQAYFELYRRAAEAIKGVDAQLKVGGPATSAGQLSLGESRAPGPEYYRRFMERVQAANVPIDFGSAHGYETDTGAGPDGAATFFKRNRADTPAGVPLYVTETNVGTTLGDLRLDQSYTAAGFL
jgi:xylan 1,4-beta-xylosidase